MSRTILMANQIPALVQIFYNVTTVPRSVARVWRTLTMFMELKRTSPPTVRKRFYVIFIKVDLLHLGFQLRMINNIEKYIGLRF